MLIIKLVAFVSGAVLMGLEIVGSRVLAPFFGNSIFVWASLISVFLTALTLGYFWGGKLADKYPFYNFLSLLIITSGVFIFIIPFIQEPVNDLIFQADFGQKLNPLISATILFLIPSILIGGISPFAVKMSVQSVETMKPLEMLREIFMLFQPLEVYLEHFFVLSI